MEGNQVILEIALQQGSNVEGTLVLEQLASDVLSLRTPPENLLSETPMFLLGDYNLKIELKDVPLAFPPPGQFVFAEAVVSSSPLGPLPTEEALSLTLAAGFVR